MHSKPTFTCYMDCQMVYTNETIPGFGSEVIIASVFGVVSLTTRAWRRVTENTSCSPTTLPRLALSLTCPHHTYLHTQLPHSASKDDDDDDRDRHLTALAHQQCSYYIHTFSKQTFTCMVFTCTYVLCRLPNS